MLTIRLPAEIQLRLTTELKRAGVKEIGGVLLAEQLAPGNFVVRDLTIQRRGTIVSFVRNLTEALAYIRRYFQSTGHDYGRFNYLGEWHSHPSFPPEPSPKDDASMCQIVGDAQIGAAFAVLLIMKIDHTEALTGSAYTYMSDGSRARSELILET